MAPGAEVADDSGSWYGDADHDPELQRRGARDCYERDMARLIYDALVAGVNQWRDWTEPSVPDGFYGRDYPDA